MMPINAVARGPSRFIIVPPMTPNKVKKPYKMPLEVSDITVELGFPQPAPRPWRYVSATVLGGLMDSLVV